MEPAIYEVVGEEGAVRLAGPRQPSRRYDSRSAAFDAALAAACSEIADGRPVVIAVRSTEVPRRRGGRRRPTGARAA